MSLLKCVATPVAAAAMLGAGTGISTAQGPTGMTADRATPVPLSQVFKRCDFTDDAYVAPLGTGSVESVISSTGSDVRADVSLINATPGIRYFVRLIENPAPTSLCRPGNPGVAAGTIDTDAGGNGNVSLQEAVLPGTTGAWVFIEGAPQEFYTSDFVAPV
ncbi:MAG: hypothetical protein JOZ49_22995 [Mycolicibacterium sp.]|nr:hypothetical protein [Mycolicibacterium sp.]